MVPMMVVTDGEEPLLGFEAEEEEDEEEAEEEGEGDTPELELREGLFDSTKERVREEEGVTKERERVFFFLSSVVFVFRFFSYFIIL